MKEQTQKKYAIYGVGAMDNSGGLLPMSFPREMSPNTLAYLKEVIDSGLTSDMVARMEQRVAAIHGVRFCVGTCGCTQAVFAAMLGMDFEEGSEVIVSSVTDYGSVAGILLEGYVPVFADTEDDAQISARTIEPLINERTRAILVVHMWGMPADMDPILDLACRHNLIVVEDVCQSILATYKGRLAGSMGDLATFSFDAEKTCGADIGGAVITDNPEIEDRVRYRAIYRAGYIEPGFGRTHDYRGFPLRIPQCTAATVLGALEILPRQIEQRQKMAALLDEMLTAIDGIRVYRIPADRTSTYWNYGFHVDPAVIGCTSDEFASQLGEEGINGIGTCRYFLMTEGLKFLHEKAASRQYPFNLNEMQYNYDSAAVTPNAKRFLDTWIRFFWTEKYNESHVELIAGAIRRVAARNIRRSLI